MSSDDVSTIILSLNYSPEPTGIAPYSTKLAEGLGARGMDVRVLTGYPHYPEWSLRAGYSGLTMHQRSRHVRITRLRHRIPSSPGFLSRLHLELSYGLRSILTRWNSPDVALSVSPALFATGLVVLKARLLRIPSGIWVQDLYGLGLEETNGENSITASLLKRIERFILCSATGIVVIHERFRDYVVKELDVPIENVQVIRNWSHVEIPAGLDKTAARKRLGWMPEEIIALHAGNMGVKQDLINLVRAASMASYRGSKVRFVLLGHGNQRSAVQDSAAGVGNISFIDPLPDAEFAEALQCADVLLVNELSGVREMSVPSKLTSYFAAGVPIVAATEIDGATADEIRASGAGLHVPPGQPEQLLDMIEDVATDLDLAAQCSSAGLPYVERILNEDRAINDYSVWLRSLAGGNK